MPSYEYGELILKNYKSNLSQNRPTSFCLGDNQSPRDILLSKAVVYSEVLHSHICKLWPCSLYTLPELQIFKNACIDLVVDIMKLSFGLIVRYLFKESYDLDSKRIWSHKEGHWTIFSRIGGLSSLELVLVSKMYHPLNLAWLQNITFYFFALIFVQPIGASGVAWRLKVNLHHFCWWPIVFSRLVMFLVFSLMYIRMCHAHYRLWCVGVTGVPKWKWCLSGYPSLCFLGGEFRIFFWNQS